MLLKTTALLLASTLLLSGCTSSKSLEDFDGQESLGSFKARELAEADKCVKEIDKMTAKARQGAVTAADFENFENNGMDYNCRAVSFPAEVFTVPVTEPLDYLNPTFRPATAYVRLINIKIWFMHELKQYPDPNDSKIMHEAWTTFSAPTVEVKSPNWTLQKFTRAGAPNHPFVNPIERVKTSSPSVTQAFSDVDTHEIGDLTVFVTDPNEFAKTWVAEVNYNMPSEQRGMAIEMIYSGLNDLQSQLAQIKYGEKLNDVPSYERLRETMLGLRSMVEYL